MFCICIQDMVSYLQSELNLWYMDDRSLGGDPEIVIEDLKSVIDKAEKLGFRLNPSKCEIMILGSSSSVEDIFNSLNLVAPGIILKDKDVELLGAPLTDSGISLTIQSKISKLKLMASRMTKLYSQQAYFLLKNSLSLPMLTYLLRSTPCWHAMEDLVEYDNILKSSLEKIVNCRFSENAWNEATLAVKFGGLGLRNATNLCFSSFLSSVHSVADLLVSIVPSFSISSDNLVMEASSACQSLTQSELLALPHSKLQSQWDYRTRQAKFGK